MGWSHPDVSLDDMVKLIKGFVDILILASGYQSSGHFALWDPQNIKRAFQWGLFFENVIRHLSSSDDYQDSLKELDSVLLEIKSNPSFPQGLAQLSSVTLSRAKSFVLEHLIQTLTLRDAHLEAFLTASIGMDLDELSGTEQDCLSLYMNRLMLQNPSANMKTEKCTDDDFTTCTLQELLKRQFAVLCVSSTEKGLDILSKTIRHNNWTESESNSFKKLNQVTSLLSHDQLVDFITWSRWRSKNLSYLLDKRTVRLVSGASMIFSAPKVQWAQLFERLNISGETRGDDYCETIELLLLGCIARRWSCLLEYFMSDSYDSINIPKQYSEICNLLTGRSQSPHSKEDVLDLKENAILEYLNVLVGGDLHQLWKLSPVLAAFAIPSWSPLFRLYLSDIHTQFKGCSSTIRCCSCTQDRKDHIDCELAERIWCLYIFHVRGSYLMHGTSSG
ncbi:hypothetical protein VitviT2T_009872 [Vitis vinifera]|uniref:Fanconi anemia group F protein n=1 Tax=Vitis vinifera TaxID=29760 RepID=A0ABY9C637_VITVI|nr:uncharacterized protein LOC100260103 [Vitis vinifera]WJZ90747.1 hypothetical protein VitviT2T_009872 [Vitis vinifera]|eukprot:XP_002270391.2 PREDICTED: uncharacterized protein LOC100260103 [Vitis vinifera]